MQGGSGYDLNLVLCNLDVLHLFCVLFVFFTVTMPTLVSSFEPVFVVACDQCDQASHTYA